MKIQTLIDKLEEFKTNLGNVNMVLVEHGFRDNAVFTYIRDMNEQDIQYNSDMQGIQGSYLQTDTVDGVVIGVIPQVINIGSPYE